MVGGHFGATIADEEVVQEGLHRSGYSQILVSHAMPLMLIHSGSQYVTCPPEPISLRLASNLMIGITRVYGQQCQIHYSTCKGGY